MQGPGPEAQADDQLSPMALHGRIDGCSQAPHHDRLQQHCDLLTIFSLALFFLSLVQLVLLRHHRHCVAGGAVGRVVQYSDGIADRQGEYHQLSQRQWNVDDTLAVPLHMAD